MFNDYKKQPREENWQDISAKLNEERAYENLGAKFDGFSAVPSHQNWTAIQGKMETPTPSYGRHIIAVAASLVLLFFIFSKVNTAPTYNFAELSNSLDLSQDLAFNLCKDVPIPALDIVIPVVKTEKKKVRKKRKKKEAKQKRLLDIILADDDNITSKVDSLLIAELLRPANMLPEESMFASTGGTYYYRQGNSFKVMYSLPEVDYKLQMPIDTQGPFLYQLVKGERH